MRKPSKPWGCRGKTLTRTPEPAGYCAAMSQENVERLRVAHEAFLAGKNEWGGKLLDPEIEWDASESPVLDNSGVYQGIEGVRQYWREWLAAWETV
jgi:hypothetical protein